MWRRKCSPFETYIWGQLACRNWPNALLLLSKQLGVAVSVSLTVDGIKSLDFTTDFLRLYFSNWIFITVISNCIWRTYFLTVDHNGSFLILSPLLLTLWPLSLSHFHLFWIPIFHIWFLIMLPLSHMHSPAMFWICILSFSYLFFDRIILHKLCCTFPFGLPKCLYILVFKCPALRRRGLHEVMEMSVREREHGVAFKFPSDGFLLQ